MSDIYRDCDSKLYSRQHKHVGVGKAEVINTISDNVAKVEIYESADGKAQVDVRFEQETVWLSQAQMTELFGRDQSVVSRHIANAIRDEEIDEKSNMQKMHIANSDRPVTFYDLDVVISVGYRIKSPQGVQCNHRLLNDKGDMIINNTGLAALTLLVAESDPNQKETLIKLIMNMLSLEG